MPPTDSVNGPSTVDTGYYTTSGGGGVFASGTASWVNRMWANTGKLPIPFAPMALPATAPVSRITLNVLAGLLERAGVKDPAVERDLAEVLHTGQRHARAGGVDEPLRSRLAGRRRAPVTSTEVTRESAPGVR